MYNYQKAVCIASALLCLSATASAQQVTLRANNVTVKQAMNQLREKTGYTFVFSSTDVNTQRQVTVGNQCRPLCRNRADSEGSEGHRLQD